MVCSEWSLFLVKLLIEQLLSKSGMAVSVAAYRHHGDHAQSEDVPVRMVHLEQPQAARGVCVGSCGAVRGLNEKRHHAGRRSCRIDQGAAPGGQMAACGRLYPSIPIRVAPPGKAKVAVVVLLMMNAS